MTSGTCYHVMVRLAVLVLLAMGLASGVARAAHEVEIRARTQLQLVRVKLVDEDTVEVFGALRDKLTGTGIAGERVSITLDGATAAATTGADGTFTVLMPATPGPASVVLGYGGGARLEKADPLAVTTDPAKAEVELSIDRLGDDPDGVRLRINATSDGAPLAAQAALDVAPVGGEAFKKLGAVGTNGDFVLSRREAGGPGTYRVRAQLAGDPTHQAAMALLTVELTSSSMTTMRLSTTQLAFEDELAVSGTVTDDDGKPLPRAAVTLMSGDRRLAQGTTGDKGTYRFEVEAEVIGQGQFGMQVQTDTGVSYIKGSRSEPAIVRVLAPQPVPVSYTIVAFIATLAAAGGFFLARKKPWEKLRRPQPPAEVPSQEGELEAFKGGLVVAKPGVVATLRRPSDDGFSGVVRDTVRGRPVEGATVVLHLGDVERSVRTQPDGSFSIEKLETGEWRAEVAASGHIAERFAVTVPHRGELRGVRIDLVPVREKVFQLYRRAAEPVLPEARLWGIWSPRQIVDHVRAKRPSPALAELTDFVEEIYFSARLAEETVLPQAEGRVTRALNERARTPR